MSNSSGEVQHIPHPPQKNDPLAGTSSGVTRPFVLPTLAVGGSVASRISSTSSENESHGRASLSPIRVTLPTDWDEGQTRFSWGLEDEETLTIGRLIIHPSLDPAVRQSAIVLLWLEGINTSTGTCHTAEDKEAEYHQQKLPPSDAAEKWFLNFVRGEGSARCAIETEQLWEFDVFPPVEMTGRFSALGKEIHFWEYEERWERGVVEEDQLIAFHQLAYDAWCYLFRYEIEKDELADRGEVELEEGRGRLELYQDAVDIDIGTLKETEEDQWLNTVIVPWREAIPSAEVEHQWAMTRPRVVDWEAFARSNLEEEIRNSCDLGQLESDEGVERKRIAEEFVSLSCPLWFAFSHSLRSQWYAAALLPRHDDGTEMKGCREVTETAATRIQRFMKTLVARRKAERYSKEHRWHTATEEIGELLAEFSM